MNAIIALCIIAALVVAGRVIYRKMQDAYDDRQYQNRQRVIELREEQSIRRTSERAGVNRAGEFEWSSAE